MKQVQKAKQAAREPQHPLPRENDSRGGRSGGERLEHRTWDTGATSWRLADAPDRYPKRVKSFQDLLLEYQDQGLCRRCGGCATFCASMQRNALEMGEGGYPRYADSQRCIECGTCYAVCSANSGLDSDVRKMMSWEDPSGRVMGVGLYRARDARVRAHSENGSALLALLIQLLEKGFIDGAVVPQEPSSRNGFPLIAKQPRDIELQSEYFKNPGLGSLLYSFDAEGQGNGSGRKQALADSGPHRLCFVGNPCQVKSLRKMEYLGVKPAEYFALKIGIFCNEDRVLSKKGEGCNLCTDHYAGYADVAISDYAVGDGFSAVLVRTSLGMMAMSQAAREVLESRGQGATSAYEPRQGF